MRTRLLRIAALGVTLGLGGLVLEVSPASASVDTGSDEIALAGMINAERAAAGLAPLAIDGRLFDSARSWSAVQAAAGDLSHDASFFAGDRPGGAGAVAENVAYNTSAATIHARLMQSPAHRANILNPAFNSVGVGEVVSADGRIFVTERFARIDASPEAAPKAAVKKAKATKAKAKAKAKTNKARSRRRLG